MLTTDNPVADYLAANPEKRLGKRTLSRRCAGSDGARLSARALRFHLKNARATGAARRVAGIEVGCGRGQRRLAVFQHLGVRAP